MKTRVLILFIMLTTWTTVLGQDGSDILYGKIDELDKSYIGDFVHLDFYNRSFRGKNIDTVTILIDLKPTKFFEHRKDDGYDNWFSWQYLESADRLDGLIVRIVKSRLDKITTDSVSVTNYLEYYKGDKIVVDKTKQIESKFSKNIIVEVLVSEKSHKRQR